jgi:hypothetical protein
MYSALFDLVSISAAILTIALVGVIGAFLFGFFGTRLKATKKNEWVFSYSFRAKELEHEDMPVDNSKGIYIHSLTACLAYVIAALCLLKWLVIIPNAQAIYDCWFRLFRGLNNESALSSTYRTSLVLMIIASLLMGYAMRYGRHLRTELLQKKCMESGRAVPIRSRGIMIYPVCFLGNVVVALLSKKPNSAAAKR